MMTKTRLRLAAAALAALLLWALPAPALQAARWYKGNVHTHSLWSDGDELPELAADWYKARGYDFLALSDHNVLMRGEKWIKVAPRLEPSIQAARKRFGSDWVQTRTRDGQTELRLKTFDEIRRRLDQRGRFLMIQAEEVTAHVHMNVLNLDELIPPLKPNPPTRLESIRHYDQAARGRQSPDRPVYVQFNHPHFFAGATAEELADSPCLTHVELVNFHHQCGSIERDWDIANSLRLSRKVPPLMGVASDDAHHYHQFWPSKANPGRGFVMVRAGRLETRAILDAMEKGEFYASCGVVLRQVKYDPAAGTLSVEVQAEEGVEYIIEFIGTLKGCDLSSRPAPTATVTGKPRPTSRLYSDQVGKVLQRVAGPRGVYKLTGRELYVRAAVRSTRPMANPSTLPPHFEQAYTQPAGWK